MKDRQRTLAMFLVVLFAAGVFATDLRTPHGVAEWVLYLPLILASVWFNRPLQVVLVSAGCSVLVIAGFWCSPPGAIHGWDLLNRGMGLADAYPFVLPPPAIDKLRFIHETICRAGCSSSSPSSAPPEGALASVG